MEFLPDKLWAKILVIAAYLVGAYFLLRALGILLPALAPFIIAWVLASLLQKPIAFVSARTRMPRKVVSFVLAGSCLAVLGVAVFFAGESLISETGRLIDMLGRRSSEIIDGVSALIGSITRKIPHLSDGMTGELVSSGIVNAFSSVIARLSSAAADALGGFISSVPAILLFAAESVAATFYFAADFRRIRRFISALIPPSVRTRLFTVRKNAVSTAVNYLKAAGVLMLVTFVEMLAGLSLLGVDYVFLLSALIAFVDFLPVLGVGTVLAPWGVFCLFSGSAGRGLGLLALWGISELLRSFIEPKLVSASVGLHPAATLVAIYCGYRFFGIGGMILCPVAVTVAVRCYDAGVFGKVRS